MGLLQSITRILAFLGKDLVEVARRPGALISLIVGPVLIMVLFGLGYDGSKLRLQAVLVVPPNSGLPTSVDAYQDIQASIGELVAVETDAAKAEQSLRDGKIDIVVFVPTDLAANFAAGKQSTLRMEYDSLSPLRTQYARLLAERLSGEVNRAIIQRTAAAALEQAGPLPGPSLSPELIASPTRAEANNLAPSSPSVTSFYGPAVLALIIQHTAVTLAALSLTRERRTGIFELLRVSSVRAIEIVAGKTLAFAALVALVSAAVMWLLLGGLAVPLLAEPAQLVGAIALLAAASLGTGLLISVASDSERQAVQLSLLLLLASVFLSGLVVDLGLFVPAVQFIGSLLPVSHGIAVLQDLMLRGAIRDPWHLPALGIIAAVTFVLAWFLLRRGMAAKAP